MQVELNHFLEIVKGKNKEGGLTHQSRRQGINVRR